MASLERLMAVIDAYGGDARRWPRDEREALEAAAEAHPTVRAQLERARALDRLLDAAARPLAGLEPLKVRILAAAAKAPPIAVPPSRRQAIRPFGQGLAAGSAARFRRSWPAVAALAASLIVGVFVGRSDLVSPAVEGLVETAGLEVASDSGLDLLGGTDEELL